MVEGRLGYGKDKVAARVRLREGRGKGRWGSGKDGLGLGKEDKVEG